jgi:hypothetical protein
LYGSIYSGSCVEIIPPNDDVYEKDQRALDLFLKQLERRK